MKIKLRFGKMKVLEMGWEWLPHSMNVLHATIPYGQKQ